MEHVIEHTHFLPRHWRNKFQSPEVRQVQLTLRWFLRLTLSQEFRTVYYEYQLVWVFRETFSVLYAPWILAVWYPKYATELVAFFKDFTLEIDGLGTYTHMNSLSPQAFYCSRSNKHQVMFVPLQPLTSINMETLRYARKEFLPLPFCSVLCLLLLLLLVVVVCVACLDHTAVWSTASTFQCRTCQSNEVLALQTGCHGEVFSKL